MDQNRNQSILDAIRKEAIRAVLERFQGEALKRSYGGEEDDGAPEGVVEELDVAYINRDGVPLAMDIIGPDAADDKELPVIITIHGGGLVIGDRRQSRRFCRELAKAGYLTFSIEYRLAPRANVCEQLDDVCAGMDLVGRRLVDYNVDFDRIFLTAESAGAYLAVYVAAMKDSKRLQEAIGHKPTRMRFRALGLISGMFYTNRSDPIGVLFSEQFYGEKVADKNFLRYMDPEHPELVRNLPPSFFVTSRGDFINSYTLDYHRALKRAGVATKLLYYGEEELGHAFVAMEPGLEQSQDAISKMLPWFEDQAERAIRRALPTPEEADRLVSVEARVASGEISHQKAWQLVRELNSATEAQLDAVALSDHRRAWTYRQLFREQERYAEVFSGLGITEESGSRVGVVTGVSVVPIICFYALNMMGVSVSMIEALKLLSPKAFRKTIKDEGITDLVLLDTCINKEVLQDIMDHRAKLGLRHVVVMRSSKQVEFPNQRTKQEAKSKWRQLKKVKHALFMPELLRTYHATPIAYGSGQNDEAAIIVHTSGTSKGSSNPVPLSDKGLNAAAARFLMDERFADMRGQCTGMLTLPLCRGYAFVDMLHVPLAMSDSVAIAHTFRDQLDLAPNMIVNMVSHEGVDTIITLPQIISLLKMLPNIDDTDFSRIKYLIVGGGPCYNEYLQSAREFLDSHGSNAVIINGYGLSETGAASIIHFLDSTKKKNKNDRVPIGRPMVGVKAMVLDDDGVWHSLNDGPCVGTLYIHSASNSCGRLGDNVLFEPEVVDGKPFLCSNDMVEVDEDGVLYHIGRANRYFVNDKGKRFDAGIVEDAIMAQPDIAACAIVPTFERLVVHDTVPLLYVQVARDAKRKPKDVVRRALKGAYLGDDRVAKNDLPWGCVIAKELPINSGGKVDIVSIMTQNIKGREYDVCATKDNNGKLRSIKLIACKDSQLRQSKRRSAPGSSASGIPKEVQKERLEVARNYLKVYGLENIDKRLMDPIAESMGVDPQTLEVYSAIARMDPQKLLGGTGGQQNGFIGGPCGALRLLLPRNISMQGVGSTEEGEKTVGKKKKKKGVPPFGTMPPMMKGMPFGQGDMQQMFAMFANAPKGKGGKPQMPFGPMPFMPKPPKKGKKHGKKGPKRPLPPVFMLVPMAPMPPKRRKKGKKGPKRPMRPMPGFPPYFGGMR